MRGVIGLVIQGEGVKDDVGLLHGYRAVDGTVFVYYASGGRARDVDVRGDVCEGVVWGHAEELAEGIGIG